MEKYLSAEAQWQVYELYQAIFFVCIVIGLSIIALGIAIWNILPVIFGVFMYFVSMIQIHKSEKKQKELNIVF